MFCEFSCVISYLKAFVSTIKIGLVSFGMRYKFSQTKLASKKIKVLYVLCICSCDQFKL